MWEIWAKLIVAKGLKTYPNSNKSPILVTLSLTYFFFFTLSQITFSTKDLVCYLH